MFGKLRKSYSSLLSFVEGERSIEERIFNKITFIAGVSQFLMGLTFIVNDTQLGIFFFCIGLPLLSFFSLCRFLYLYEYLIIPMVIILCGIYTFLFFESAGVTGGVYSAFMISIPVSFYLSTDKLKWYTAGILTLNFTVLAYIELNYPHLVKEYDSFAVHQWDMIISMYFGILLISLSMNELKKDFKGKEEKLTEQNLALIEANNKIKEREHYLSMINQTSQIGVWKINITKAQINLSDEIIELLGFQNNNPKSFDEIKDLILPEYKKELYESISKLFHKSLPINMQIGVRNITNTKKFHLVLNASKTLNDIGEVELFGTYLNVSEHIEMRDKFTEAQRNYELLAKNISDVVILEEVYTGKKLYFSPSVKEALGYTMEEMYDVSISQDMTEADKRQMAQAHINLVKGTSTLERCEIQVKRKDGQKIWVELNISLIRDKEGKPYAFQRIGRDISERIKLRNELQEAYEQEKKLNELKSLFIAMVSHQFRTPMTVIQSNVSLLNMMVQDDEKGRISKLTGRIKTSIKQLTELMEDVLIIGKLETESSNLNLESCDLSDLCFNEVLEEYNLNDTEKILYKESGDFQFVNLDKGLFRHAVSNLVDNAIKYSKDDKLPILHLKYAEDVVNIVVEDFGVGIKEEDQSKIFEPFFRSNEVMTIKGSGLGLMIVKTFTELHGGTVRVESEFGKGTKFTITLPYGEELEELPQASEEVLPV